MAGLGFSVSLSKSVAIVATLKMVINKFKVLGQLAQHANHTQYILLGVLGAFPRKILKIFPLDIELNLEAILTKNYKTVKLTLGG